MKVTLALAALLVLSCAPPPVDETEAIASAVSCPGFPVGYSCYAPPSPWAQGRAHVAFDWQLDLNPQWDETIMWGALDGTTGAILEPPDVHTKANVCQGIRLQMTWAQGPEQPGDTYHAGTVFWSVNLSPDAVSFMAIQGTNALRLRGCHYSYNDAWLPLGRHVKIDVGPRWGLQCGVNNPDMAYRTETAYAAIPPPWAPPGSYTFEYPLHLNIPGPYIAKAIWKRAMDGCNWDTSLYGRTELKYDVKHCFPTGCDIQRVTTSWLGALY